MSLIRFATALDLAEAFPTLVEDMHVPLTAAEPIAFLHSLLPADTPEDAITFSAYLLPRREAVWWSCQCIRTLVPQRSNVDQALLDIAENWVRDPTLERRVEALREGMAGDRTSAACWAALGAAWSGGSMLGPGEPTVPAPAHLTAKAARAAVLIALSKVGALHRTTCLRACVDACVKIVRSVPADA